MVALIRLLALLAVVHITPVIHSFIPLCHSAPDSVITDTDLTVWLKRKYPWQLLNVYTGSAASGAHASAAANSTGTKCNVPDMFVNGMQRRYTSRKELAKQATAALGSCKVNCVGQA